MGEFRLLYLLCMLRFPVPLHSLHHELLSTVSCYSNIFKLLLEVVHAAVTIHTISWERAC
jgi:hypothetical protein